MAEDEAYEENDGAFILVCVHVRVCVYMHEKRISKKEKSRGQMKGDERREKEDMSKGKIHTI